MNTTKIMKDVSRYLGEHSQYDVKLSEINVSIFLIGEEYKIHVTAKFSDEMELTYEISDKKYFERDAVQRRADVIVKTALKRFEYIYAGWEFREEVETRNVEKASDIDVKFALELIESGRLNSMNPWFKLLEEGDKKIIAYITDGWQESHEMAVYNDDWDVADRVSVSFSTDFENYDIQVVEYRRLTKEELDEKCHIEDDEVEVSAEKNLCDEIIEAINCEVKEQYNLPAGDTRISFENGLVFIVDSAGYKVDIYDDTLVGTYYKEEKILQDKNYNNVDFELGWMNKAVEKNLEECQSCSGKGEVMEEWDSAFGTTESYWTTCQHCEGAGEVEESNEIIIECDDIVEYNKVIDEYEGDVVSHYWNDELQFGYVVVPR